MKTIICYLFFLSAFTFLNAQNPEWVTITSESRISDIRDIVDDNQNIWITTNIGLVKFDKSTKKTFLFDTSNSGLPCNDLSSIAIDSTGNKWIGTYYYGLIKYNDFEWSVFDTTNSDIICNNVRMIEVDFNSNIWLAVGGYNIMKFDGFQWLNYNYQGNLDYRNWIYSMGMSIDQHGYIWVGFVYGGVYKFNGVDWEDYSYVLGDNDLQSLVVDRKGKVWFFIKGISKGLAYLEDGKWQVIDSDYSSGVYREFENISFIYTDLKNNLWFDLESELVKYDNNDFFYFIFKGINKIEGVINDENYLWVISKDLIYQKNGDNGQYIRIFSKKITDDKIRSIYLKNDNIWINSMYNVTYFDGVYWENYDLDLNYELDYSYRYILSSGIDKNNNLWLCNSSELIKIDNVGEREKINLPISSPIQILFIDNENKIWIGNKKGLQKYSNDKWETLDTGNCGLPDNLITTIIDDIDGNLWFGTKNGIAKFDGINWTVYDTLNSNIPDNYINCIAVDSTNNAWIGTNKGFAKLENGIWIQYNNSSNGLACDTVSAIGCEKDGNVWIGSYKGNISKFDGTNIQNFSSNDYKLLPNKISSIAIDDENNKWFGLDGSGIAIYREGGVSDNIMMAGNMNDIDSEISLDVIGKINTFPNPTSETLNIQINNIESGNITLKLFDIFGREVETIFDGYTNGNLNLNNNIGNISSGTYFLVITTKSGRTAERVVINN